LTERPPASATPAELTGASRRFTLLDAERRRIVGFASPADNAVERAIVVDGLTVGWLVLTPFESVSYGAEKRFADAQARTGWVVGGAAVLLAAAVALWASRRLLKPVRQVADATHRLAAGDHATRVPESDKDDEIGRLARDFNQLALTLQRNEAMRREFMADVSHELRTPLGVLHGELEALEDGVRQLDAQALRSLKAEVTTLHKLVDDLYELSLADVGALSYRKAELDLREIIDDTAGAFGERLRSSGLALQLELPPGPLPAFGDARRLRQLFANLLENSCRYTDAGGALRLQARREGRQMLIDLHDSAPGVRSDQLPRLFERFFRAEASRSRASGGAGLGLSICERIVQAHEGRIEARPSPLGGLWLRVELPALG
jgi:two-component system sensor histidine kinase BaeS